MSVRFQFAGDKDISVGRAGGASLFKLPGAISFPAAGSYNSTLYSVTYPVAEGGSSFTNPVIGGAVPNQNCDVDVLNDGSGGTYIDWSSATNITYKAAGIYFATDVNAQTPYGATEVEVPTGSGTYYDPEYVNPTYEHDGLGSWQNGTPAGPYYYVNGTAIYNGGNNQSEVPAGSGSSYDNGTYDIYVWDGYGAYNTQTGGSYFSNGTVILDDYSLNVEVPSGSNIFYNDGTGSRYVWSGNGGYSSNGIGSLFAYGTFIYNDGSFDYYWDGNGGYYAV